MVAELLGAELSELLLGEALEGLQFRMKSQEPASQSAQPSESQQPEEMDQGAGEPQLSNIPEFQRPRTNSEIERYSDQVAKLFTSLAGINEANEEQAADEPEVIAGVESGRPDEARMTPISDEADQPNQAANSGDDEGSSVQPNATSEQATSGAQQEEVDATGDCESSATREELDERSSSSAIESPLPAANEQEDPSKTSSENSDASPESQSSLAATSVVDEPQEHSANHDKIANELEQAELPQARTSSADSNFSDSSSAELPEELARKEEHSSEEGSCCVSECICDDDAEDFCGETASNSTLRRLKMNTFEDVLVCEQNRQSMAAARRLFGQLAEADGTTGKQTSGPKELEKPKVAKWGGSLSSAEEPEEESDDMDEEELRHSASNKGSPSDNNHLTDPEGLLKAFDTIKIVRRSGSSASSSNFRQTLVCSVSPTSQLGGSNLDISVAETNQPVYPIDGEEMLQCRAAFRENKRLIEEQQERARNISADCTSPNKHRALSPLTGGAQSASGTRNFRLNRTDPSYLDRSVQQSKCSRCKLRVYPVDRMELDFTRTTLNIHRNCFKCQICSTLLR